MAGSLTGIVTEGSANADETGESRAMVRGNETAWGGDEDNRWKPKFKEQKSHSGTGTFLE